MNKPSNQQMTLLAIDDINFKTLAEDAPVTLWLTDIQGNAIFTNNQYKNFIGREKVEQQGGKAWFNALHPDDREYCLTIFKDAFESHKAFTMEYRLKRRDGEYRHFIDHGEPYIDNSGSFAGFVGSSTDITEQKLSEDELKKSHDEMTQYNHEMQLINQLNSYLQVCRTVDETYPIVSYYAEQIFPECDGALFLFNESKSLVEAKSQWGNSEITNSPVITPDDCWSLRQGKTHTTLDNDARLRCNHVEDSIRNYICEPIIAQGEMLGMLHVEFANHDFDNVEDKNQHIESRKRLTKITADNLALSLVSLKLREALQNQSVKDPLTKLFNRRYMEESLEREIHRCVRGNAGLGLIMADVDHFKKFNDQFGHDAGDLVLTEFATLLQNQFRSSDIICRYGGEEFIIIMPTASKEIVLKRAEEIRQSIKELTISVNTVELPKVTSSFGVSYINGTTVVSVEKLLKAADVALYQAKNDGRDQVIFSDEDLDANN
jgi:diguanylate cyclase (GGDEF)-like protein/PAS domain S-box-containing protein